MRTALTDLNGTPLRFSTEYTVDRPSFEGLRRTGSGLGLEVKKEEARRLQYGSLVTQDTDTEFHFLDGKFLLGDGFHVTTTAKTEEHARYGQRQLEHPA